MSSKYLGSENEGSVQNMKLTLRWQTPTSGVLKLQKLYSVPHSSTAVTVIITIGNIKFVECLL